MKFKKKFLIMVFIINVLMILVSMNKVKVEATMLDSMEEQASDFIDKGKDKVDGVDGVTKAVTTQFTGLGQILTMVGAGVMVIVTSYMGIKYIISPPDKQAALKQQLIGVVVAGVVIFGAYGIWSAVVNVVRKF